LYPIYSDQLILSKILQARIRHHWAFLKWALQPCT